MKCYSCDFSGGPAGLLPYTWTSDSADLLPTDHPAVVHLCAGCATYAESVGVTLTAVDA